MFSLYASNALDLGGLGSLLSDPAIMFVTELADLFDSLSILNEIPNAFFLGGGVNVSGAIPTPKPE